MVITKSQTEKLKSLFADHEGQIEFEYGMRYGKPSLESAIDRLTEKGCTRILLFPMYPQYSGPTTASTYDSVFTHILKRRVVPTLRVAEPYYRKKIYIDVLAAVINENLDKMPDKPEYLIISFHGIPLRYITNGDVYCCMCTETKDALVKKLNFPKDKIIQTYQSRFGKEPWLTPYADETVIKLAKKNVKNIAIAAPGFTTDCLETIDELGTEAEHAFKEHGGEKLTLIPCLNDHTLWIEGMKDLIKTELGSWLDKEADYYPQECGSACAIKCPIDEHEISNLR